MEQNKPDDREWFEEKVFGERFLASIKPTGLGGCLTYMAQGCPPKHELVAKDADGNYTDEAVSAMWFGFQLAQNRESQRIAELEGERDRLAAVVGDLREQLAGAEKEKQAAVYEGLTIQALRIAECQEQWDLDGPGIIREFIGEIGDYERGLARREDIKIVTTELENPDAN